MIFGHPTALKVFNETGKAWDDKQIKAEIDLLTSVQHEHLNRLYAICFNGPSRCLVLEYMDGGALDDRLANKKKEHTVLEWGERIRVLLHVGRALAHLHSLKPPMIHRYVGCPTRVPIFKPSLPSPPPLACLRDVKCGNVLLPSRGAGGRVTVLAKLADFGTARHTAEIMKKDRESIGNGTELITHQSTRNVCGTRPYMPPECTSCICVLYICVLYMPLECTSYAFDVLHLCSPHQFHSPPLLLPQI
jgi:serine/threonine protein kinase